MTGLLEGYLEVNPVDMDIPNGTLLSNSSMEHVNFFLTMVLYSMGAWQKIVQIRPRSVLKKKRFTSLRQIPK